MPCTPKRARELMRDRKAAVYRRVPFTIILKERLTGDAQPLEERVDPGSKTTGFALVLKGKSGDRVVYGIELQHRGQAIQNALQTRSSLRRGRRNRKTRYRAPRFLNRTSKAGWLAPSIQSRVDNCATWTNKLSHISPISSIAIETTRFDTQLMADPLISGVQYQQGTLQGYEVREYLLEHWKRMCGYCDKKDVPFEIDHIKAKSRGGSDRVSNLTLACHECNAAKDNRDVREFLEKNPVRLAKILAHCKAPLKDAAAMNATRYATGNALKAFGLPTTFWSGGRTKKNRITQGYHKAHWIDAACVGKAGSAVSLYATLKPLALRATGRGSRQKCLTNKYGFTKTKAKTTKRRNGFQTGDLVRAIVKRGKAPDTHIGRVVISGARFDIKTKFGTIGTTAKNLTLLQRDFGYAVA